MKVVVPDPAVWLLWQNLLLAHVALAMVWWLGTGLSATWRRPVRGMVWFNGLVALAAGVEWWCARSEAPAPLLQGLALGLGLMAGGVLWRLGRLVTGMPPPPAVLRHLVSVVPGVPVAFGVAVALWPSPAMMAGQAAMASAFMAVVLGGASWQIGRRLGEVGLPRSRLLLAALAAVWVTPLGADAARSLGAWSPPAGWESLRLLGVTARAVALFGANLLVAYHVFGRMLHAVQQLAGPHPLSGLMPLPMVRAMLAREARWHARRRRHMAVIALHLPAFDALSAGWGLATAQSVMAELAQLVRLRLQPADVLGLADRHTLVLGLLDTSEVLAATRMHALAAVVAAERGLHPAAADGLRLATAMAMVEPGDDPVSALERVRAASLRAAA